MASREELKRDAAEAALAYVKPGMILGLGTGSTARHFLAGVARLVASGMDLKGVPTSLATAALEALGAKIELRKNGDEPFRTDNGNHILDAHFGAIRGPAKLAGRISSIPGVVGHGLFLKMAHAVLVASQMGVRTLAPTRTT